MLLKKKPAEMLIEQIIEFELRALGPLDCTCTPTTISVARGGQRARLPLPSIKTPPMIKSYVNIA